MKIFVLLLAVLCGLASYYVTFMAFWDSWFPYYYEDYISYYFLGGVALIAVLPLLVASIKFKFFPSSETAKFRALLYKSVLGVNFVVVVVSVLTFAYMLSNGIWLNGPGTTTHQIVPENK
jgi:hypothetical protein